MHSNYNKADALSYKIIGAAIEVHKDILELKSVETVMPAHKAKLLSYMKLTNVPLGLIINFHQPILKNGISRMILPGADK